ncbi:hypothetical protein ACFFV7_39985 [Nonomuraea spiralis]|uniref:Uncharacterized protein n=1 Tax=Nonomuraea spiralis TaxID=46182 RepID=A0ABV5ITM7_9ACTN|nr:hypothetical protein [Nonomuraea spiralis]GGT40890.1 hypothetical protein GCM10010176_100880 [Nonomuraea spiralis]
MRTRVPAALLLVLSWLLPAIGHGEIASQVAAVTAPAQAAAQTPAQTPAEAPVRASVQTVVRAEAHRPAAASLRSTPPPQPLAQARPSGHDQAGPAGQALPAAGPARPRPSWTAVVRPLVSRSAADRPQGAPAARAPPSTVL